MIKHFLKDSNIKSIEYLSLNGPDIKTSLVFRTSMDDFFRQFDIFGKIITNVFGVIEPESDLAKCINSNKENVKAKTMRIDFGTYKVKFARLLTCQEWTEVIALISECMARTGVQLSQTQKSITNAFESIQKVADTTRIKDLNDKLNSRLIDAISTDKDTTDLFLGSKIPEDFTLASSFRLKLKEGRTYTEIQYWDSSPTVDQIIKALHNDNHLETSQEVQRALEEKRIRIAFRSPTVKSRLLSIQSLIHGSIVMDDVRYFKLCTVWYRISPSAITRINRDFIRLAEENTKDTGFSLLDALKYTWSYTAQSFSINDMQQVLGIVLTETDAEHIVNMLLGKVRPCTGDQFILTEVKNMYLLPSSNSSIVEFVEKVADALGDRRKCREKTLTYICDLSQRKETVNDKTKETMGREFEVVVQENGETQTTYKVKNPIISDETKKKLNAVDITERHAVDITKRKLHDDDITDLLSYMRSLLPLSEREFNELYLHPQHKYLYIIPGDRVFVKYVELFDILIHDPKERVTYLVHIKDGFDVKIRDVCSQIRVSATLFWMDYMEGTRTQAEGFWKAGTSKGANSVYRTQLREKLEAIKKEKLITFFDHDVKIVFVLGFRDEIKDCLKSPSQLPSTIAKIELLTLYADFAKYQVGGWKKFELKVLQLKSDYGSSTNPKPPRNEGR